MSKILKGVINNTDSPYVLYNAEDSTYYDLPSNVVTIFSKAINIPDCYPVSQYFAAHHIEIQGQTSDNNVSFQTLYSFWDEDETINGQDPRYISYCQETSYDDAIQVGEGVSYLTGDGKSVYLLLSDDLNLTFLGEFSLDSSSERPSWKEIDIYNAGNSN